MKLDAKDIEEAFDWDADPRVFIFNNEIPGKVRMHTRRLEWDDWVQIDKTYPMQMKLRESLLQSKWDEVFVTNHDESTRLAKQELLDKIIDYLPGRFPDKFEARENGIYNKMLDEFVSADASDPEDPLIRAARLTQEDWVIMQWSDKDEAYALTAGVVLFPMRWSLLEKFNQSMPLIHKPVHAFTKHLLPNVQSLFKKMVPSAPVWRGNWAIFNDLDGPLDLFTPTGHTDRNEINQISKYEGEATGTKLTFRAEYQTLCKLPRSEAIVFSIRTYQKFLKEFRDFPISDAEGLCRAIETLDPDIHVYKGADFWKDASLQYLRSIIAEREFVSMPANKAVMSYALPAAAVLCAAAIFVRFTVFK